MKCDKKAMILYAVTDRTWNGEKNLYEQVEDALKGGVTCIQLREKKMSYGDFLKEAVEIQVLCQQYKVPLIINDNVEIALQCKADGVHIGQQDMQVKDVRAIIGEKMMLGVSAHTVEQAIFAEKNGADYLGVGAVFATSTKLDADTVSKETLTLICKAVSIPVVAIGGIAKTNIMELTGTGIDGVALVSAIFASKDIKRECKEMKVLSEKMVQY